MIRNSHQAVLSHEYDAICHRPAVTAVGVKMKSNGPMASLWKTPGEKLLDAFTLILIRYHADVNFEEKNSGSS